MRRALGIARSAIISFYRNVTRHPGFAALNVAGLTAGIAVVLIIGTFVGFQRQFNAWIPGADRIYVASTQLLFPGVGNEVHSDSMPGLASFLQADFGDVPVTRLVPQKGVVRRGDSSLSETVTLVDPAFLEVVPLKFVEGDASTALQAPDALIVSDRMRQKLFGTDPALGKTVSIVGARGVGAYTISGVVETRPAHSDLNLDLIRSVTPTDEPVDGSWRQWGQIGAKTLARLPSDDAADQLSARMDDFVDRRAGNYFGDARASTLVKIRFMPLVEAHLADRRMRAALGALSFIGFLAFAVALVNYVNLATARADLRAREVGVRKALGASLLALRAQFIGEALLATMLAAMGGVLITILALPLISRSTGLDVSLGFHGQWLLWLKILALVLAAGGLAGIYPAMVIARISPARVLSASRSSSSSGRFGIRMREALVLVQFIVVITFSIVLIGLQRQIDHLRSADLGFDAAGLMIVTSTGEQGVTDADRAEIRSKFRAVPGVIGVSAADQAPGEAGATRAAPVIPPSFQSNPQQAPIVLYTVAGPDFFTTHGSKLLAGRFPSARYGADQMSLAGDGGETNVVLSTSAVEALGLGDARAAIGKSLRFGAPDGRRLRVVGVVQDMRFRAPLGGVNKMLFFFDRDPNTVPLTAVRFRTVAEPELRAALSRTWHQTIPGVPFRAVTAQDNLNEAYRPLTSIVNMLGIGALASGILGAFGLYSLAAFSTSRRRHEIAVRKVCGARRRDVVRLVTLQFLRPVVLGNLLAWPLSFAAMNVVLGLFDVSFPLTLAQYLAVSGLWLAGGAAIVAALVFISANIEPASELRQS